LRDLPASDPAVPAKPPRWGRGLALLTAAVFCVSAAFPVVAGLSRDTARFPRSWGVADVVLAFVLALMAFAVTAASGRVPQEAHAVAYRAYRLLLHGILLLLVVFFLAGDRIAWNNCLTGFAWRAWLLLYALPSWLALVRRPFPPA